MNAKEDIPGGSLAQRSVLSRVVDLPSRIFKFGIIAAFKFFDSPSFEHGKRGMFGKEIRSDLLEEKRTRMGAPGSGREGKHEMNHHDDLYFFADTKKDLARVSEPRVKLQYRLSHLCQILLERVAVTGQQTLRLVHICSETRGRPLVLSSCYEVASTYQPQKPWVLQALFDSQLTFHRFIQKLSRLFLDLNTNQVVPIPLNKLNSSSKGDPHLDRIAKYVEDTSGHRYRPPVLRKEGITDGKSLNKVVCLLQCKTPEDILVDTRGPLPLPAEAASNISDGSDGSTAFQIEP
ncbi:hypothetical protein C8F04DRAFT_1185633 [Mycena alexandri]|uniref:Uncharacterized protein n=1 Tax=Mycena alexandri TaxID=1745969 RepID=A0AAD6X1T6_9AGAR|nr:hypothetical protein C8F04DRAFT_1185633 [Mycena alexandri]